MQKLLLRYKEVILSALLAFIILMTVFLIKGVYPFGSLTIAYYDMNISIIPLYTHTKDFFDGNVSMVYDWYLACGEGVISTMSSFVLSPFNLFFIFVKRDFIAQSMSYFLALKMCCMAFSMSFYTKKRYPELSCLYNIAGALLYAFSGYVIQYYTNIYFLDILAVFPLLMHCLNNLLEKNKCGGYLIMLALCCIISIYFSYMICLFIIVYTTAHILFVCNKKDIKKCIANLGIYTFLAFIISVVIVWPVVAKTLLSNRINISKESSYFDIISTAFCSFWGNKMLMFFGCELGIVSVAWLLFRLLRDKGSKKPFYAALFKLTFLIIPFMYEGTNLLWHTGTYIHFPMRFAFVIVFESLNTLTYFLSTGKDKAVISTNNGLVNKLLYAASVPVLAGYCVLLYRFASQFIYTGISNKEGYLTMALPFLAGSFVAAGIIMALKDNRYKRILVFAMVIMQTTIMSYGFIAPKNDNDYILHDKYGLRKTISLRNSINIKNDNLSRIKNTDSLLPINYPMVLGLPGLTHWSNDTTVDYYNMAKAFGETIGDRMVGDAGGTVFSDALFNVKYTASFSKKNDKLYTQRDKLEDLYIYDMNYQLPFGITVNEDFLNVKLADRAIENINTVYKALTHKDDEIIRDCLTDDYITKVEPCNFDGEIINLDFSDENIELDGEKTKTTLTIPVRGTETLYIKMLYSSKDVEDLFGNKAENSFEKSADETEKNKTYNFIVNGEKPVVLEYGDEKIYTYPNTKNYGFLEAGTFTNETVTLEIISKTEDISDLEVGLLNNDKLKGLCDSFADKGASNVDAHGRTLSMNKSTYRDGYVFIPVEYDKNWSAKVNNEPAEVVPVLGNAFMAVKIPAGESTIKMSYFPKEVPFGAVISALGVLLAVICLRLQKSRYSITDNKAVQNICLVGFALIAVCFIIFFNIIPILFGIVYKLKYLVWLFDLKG